MFIYIHCIRIVPIPVFLSIIFISVYINHINTPYYQLLMVFFHYFYLLLFEVINWFQRGSSLYIFITEPTVCFHENLMSKHFLENYQFILPKIKFLLVFIYKPVYFSQRNTWNDWFPPLFILYYLSYYQWRIPQQKNK